jgi:outer membrane protein OmpA-like peptidoglycan-associated protein
MTYRLLFSLPLAAALALPGVAQQATPADSTQSAQPQMTQQQPADQATQPTTDVNSPAANPDKQLEPLKPPEREGFWGRMNPFARKSYVKRQLQPIRDRENELDDLTASNSRMLKDVDTRATAGIQRADQHAALADQHAVDAANRAQQANQTAAAASNHLQSVSQVVENLDQYQSASQVEIRFRPGATTLSQNAKDALDQLAQAMKDQKGYVVEVQGFAPGRGAVGIQQSQHLADSVVRYLVINHQIPVYRIYELGLGNAQMPAAQDSQNAQTAEPAAKPAHGSRVEVTLLKNGIDNLGHATQASSMSQPQ